MSALNEARNPPVESCSAVAPMILHGVYDAWIIHTLPCLWVGARACMWGPLGGGGTWGNVAVRGCDYFVCGFNSSYFVKGVTLSSCTATINASSSYSDLAGLCAFSPFSAFLALFPIARLTAKHTGRRRDNLHYAKATLLKPSRTHIHNLSFNAWPLNSPHFGPSGGGGVTRPSSRVPHPAPRIQRPASRVSHPASLMIPRPASRVPHPANRIAHLPVALTPVRYVDNRANANMLLSRLCQRKCAAETQLCRMHTPKIGPNPTPIPRP